MNSGVNPLRQMLRTDAPGATLAEAVRRREAWLPCFLADAATLPAFPRLDWKALLP